jgi:hypothetical protein
VLEARRMNLKKNIRRYIENINTTDVPLKEEPSTAVLKCQWQQKVIDETGNHSNN